MNNTFVKLNSAETVKNFVNTISKYDCEFELVLDKYVVDAKSIMGILSLDLTKVIKLIIYSDNEDIVNDLKDYIVK